jgi:outer membrane protein assembly factor BamB
MGRWSHSRHGPGGNAVSADRLVQKAERIRWLAGPLVHASNIVTAGGRFFTHGVIARDAFNGLLLWNRKLDPPPSRIDSSWHGVKGSALPVASADRFYAVNEGNLQALDAATGETVKVYADAGAPVEFLHIGPALVTTDAKTSTVRALDAESGRLLWSHKAVIPVTSMVAGDGGVYFYEGGQDFKAGNHISLRRKAAGPRAVVKLDLATGKPAWRLTEADHPWAAKGKRLSYHRGFLVCELSRFTDNPTGGNAIQCIAADTGKVLWGREFVPHMNHRSQARALHIGSLIWISNQFRDESKKRVSQWLGLDPATGKTMVTHNTGSASHCTPPVATERFFVRGLSLTDIATGLNTRSALTKHSCSLDAGAIPANGLIYIAPKHCTCWPMFKCYSAIAPAKSQPGPAAKKPEVADFAVERGPAFGHVSQAAAGADAGWPCYRADLWRSASTATPVPANLKVLWTADLGDWPRGVLAQDWKENNPGVRGPVTPPVAAGGLVLVAQGDRHRVVALDAKTGRMRWAFTADGRVDTPPTLAGGLCLLGTRSGTVYALRAKDGQLAWRLRVAPEDERIVAFGQLESPWPAAGSVLVVGDTAYVAAGRHPLAYGGIRILALETATGAVKWVNTINSGTYDRYKDGQGLDVDIFDLLVGEARRPSVPAAGGSKRAGVAPDYITMGRWQIDPASGKVGCDWKNGFAYCRTGGAGVMVPRGLWTYGQRMFKGNNGYLTKKRPLAAFRDGAIFTSTDDHSSLCRVDFTPESIAAFKGEWHTHRHKVPRVKDKKTGRPKKLGRTDYWLLRLHEDPNNATWTAAEVFGVAAPSVFTRGGGWAWTAAEVFGSGRGLNVQGIGAVVLAGDTVFVAGTQGRLLAFADDDGRKRAERDLPPLVWDGMAAAHGRLYVSTADGKVLALGRK